MHSIKEICLNLKVLKLMIYSILLTDTSAHWNAAVVSANENVRSKSLGIQYFKGSSWKNIIDRINRTYQENPL